MQSIENKQYITFNCEKCSAPWSFDRIKHAEKIRKIKALGHFECYGCEVKQMREKARKDLD